MSPKKDNGCLHKEARSEHMNNLVGDVVNIALRGSRGEMRSSTTFKQE